MLAYRFKNFQKKRIINKTGICLLIYWQKSKRHQRQLQVTSQVANKEHKGPLRNRKLCDKGKGKGKEMEIYSLVYVCVHIHTHIYLMY